MGTPFGFVRVSFFCTEKKVVSDIFIVRTILGSALVTVRHKLNFIISKGAPFVAWYENSVSKKCKKFKSY